MKNKINYGKASMAIRNGEKLPRKVKKHILGKRISKSRLNRLIKSVKVINHAGTMYEEPVVEPHLFCPHCGCSGIVGTGNMTSYPEHWENFYCSRCHEIVAFIDNSPFTHILEYTGDFDKFPA